MELSDVAKTYETAAERLTVLDDINITVEAGEFVSIMGPSGSGKSTLMHILGCLDVASKGTYRFDGQDVAMLSRKDLAQLRNRSIGFVFQNFHLLPRMNALKNVEVPMSYAGINARERRERASELLGELGLFERLRHFPNELSGGQKQRVAIARALANHPRLLLADEPTGALDQTTGTELMNLFAKLHESGMTIVLITHDRDIAARADRTIVLVDGRVVEGGGLG